MVMPTDALESKSRELKAKGYWYMELFGADIDVSSYKHHWPEFTESYQFHFCRYALGYKYFLIGSGLRILPTMIDVENNNNFPLSLYAYYIPYIDEIDEKGNVKHILYSYIGMNYWGSDYENHDIEMGVGFSPGKILRIRFGGIIAKGDDYNFDHSIYLSLGCGIMLGSWKAWGVCESP